MFKTSHSALKRMFTESLSKVGLEEFIKQSTDHKTAEFLSGLVQICKKERMTQLRLFQINNYNHYGFLFTRFQAVFYGVGMPLLVGYFSFEKMKIWQAKNRLTKSRMRMLQISLAISLLASFGCFYFTHRVGKTLVRSLDLVQLDSGLAYRVTKYGLFGGKKETDVPVASLQVSLNPKKGDYALEDPKTSKLSYLSMKGTGSWKVSRKFFDFCVENPGELTRVSLR